MLVDYGYDYEFSHRIANQAHHTQETYQAMYDANKTNYVDLSKASSPVFQQAIRKLLHLEESKEETILVPEFMLSLFTEVKVTSVLTPFNVNQIILVGKKTEEDKFVTSAKQLELNALMIACYHNDIEGINKLHAAGADRRYTMDFQTLLHFIEASPEKNMTIKVKTFRHILDLELAVPTVENNDHETIYHCFIKRFDHIDLLTELCKEFNLSIYDFKKCLIATAFEYKNIPAAGKLIKASLEGILDVATLAERLRNARKKQQELAHVFSYLKIFFTEKVIPFISELSGDDWGMITADMNHIFSERDLKKITPVNLWIKQITESSPATLLTTLEMIESGLNAGKKTRKKSAVIKSTTTVSFALPSATATTTTMLSLLPPSLLTVSSHATATVRQPQVEKNESKEDKMSGARSVATAVMSIDEEDDQLNGISALTSAYSSTVFVSGLSCSTSKVAVPAFANRERNKEDIDDCFHYPCSFS